MIIGSIISILIIILVYLQSAAAKANSGTILGNDNVQLFENTKARGVDKVILWSTGILTTVFFIMIVISHVI